MIRACEICGCNNQPIELHRQQYLLREDNRLNQYLVLACSNCDFIYASFEEHNESYYGISSHHLTPEGAPKGLSQLHIDFINFIESSCPKLSKNSAVLDIGASMGHFLSLFKARGYTTLTGIEPAKNSNSLAKTAYNLNVLNESIDSFKTQTKFDLIIMSGVLEHLSNLKDKIEKTSSLLNPDGYIFIAVPDASKFSKNTQTEPFLEFASEHINFFTPHSLKNLFEINGHTLIKYESIYNRFYGNFQIASIFKKNTTPTNANTKIQNTIGSKSIIEYIDQGNKILSSINKHLEPLVLSQEPIVIFGTGQLAGRLLATSNLSKTNIKFFVDNNKELHQKCYCNRLILSPDALINRCETVLIASSVHCETITNKIKSIKGFNGRIIAIA